MARYEKPGWFTTNVANNVIGLLAERLGLSLGGAQQLAVRGRTSGAWRTTPVNPVTVGGDRYLVSPRGNTDWVRNMRAAGGGELRLGRKREAIRVTELADDDKPIVLRAYLRRWKREVGKFFDASPGGSEADFRRIAPNHPVFRIMT